MTELFFLQGEDSFFLTRGKLRRIARVSKTFALYRLWRKRVRAQPVFDAWKITKNRPREQNLPRFADRGGSECRLSPFGIVYEKIGRKMIPGYAERLKTDLCDRA